MAKNLPAMQKTWVQPLGRQDPLEKGMATHSSILAWRIPRTEEPGGLQSCDHKESDLTEQLTPPVIIFTCNSFFFFKIFFLNVDHFKSWASLVVQLVKNSPAIQETLVQLLGWEDPLGKG